MDGKTTVKWLQVAWLQVAEGSSPLRGYTPAWGGAYIDSYVWVYNGVFFEVKKDIPAQRQKGSSLKELSNRLSLLSPAERDLNFSDKS